MTMAKTKRIQRKKFKVRTCAADGCRERFMPTKEDHIYHSETCASYMRVKEFREKRRREKRAEEKAAAAAK